MPCRLHHTIPLVLALLMSITQTAVAAPPTPRAIIDLAASRQVASKDEGQTVVPFVLYSGHIYVDAMINGKGPFHFVFDSGALNVLTPATAQQLGLASSGKVEASGTGGTQSASVTKIDSVAIGNLTMRNQKFYVVDLPPSDGEGRLIDGLIGFDWLSQFRTRIDYSASTLTFYGRQAPQMPGAATPTKLSFRGRLAQVEANLDGITGNFSIDTGSNGSLILYPAFASAHALASRYKAKTEVMSAVGIGGPVYALTTRAGEFIVGGHTVKKPVTFLPKTQTGASADSKISGRIGSGILRRFTVTLDYPRSQAYFEPNAMFTAPDLADRSGLRVNSSAGGFKVVFVVKDSPAMLAGFVKDDIIVTIDGQPASGVDLAALRTQFKGAPGTSVALGLATGKTATLVLQDID
jgi:predicted aspartyl protease